MKNLIIAVVLGLSLLFVDCSAKKDIHSDTKTSSGQTDNKTGNSGGEKSVKQNITKSELDIKTSDGLSISVNYFYQILDNNALQPVVVLIHQFNQNKEQWEQSFIDSLVDKGFKVLAYDIRGHGKSSKVNYSLDKLLTEADEAPKDMIAVFGWLKQQVDVDTNRIGVMGTSIGGNLGCYARYNLGAKVVVSISNSKEGFYTFMKINEMMMGRVFLRISNVLFICGKNDGNHEADEKDLYENYLDAPKDIKVYDSDKHGIFLIREHTEINNLAIDWFKKYL